SHHPPLQLSPTRRSSDLAGHCSRVQAALTDMGIQITALEPPADIAFGRELTSCFQNSRGFSRAWYVERLPGTDLDPGWLFRLLRSEEHTSELQSPDHLVC